MAPIATLLKVNTSKTQQNELKIKEVMGKM
jgi:hypothetical protein